MPDYAGNSHKQKKAEEPKPEKNIERVTTGEVVVKKKTVGSKFRDIFIMADFKSVALYVVTDVLLPAAKNMIVDGASKGVERMMYGPAATRHRPYGPGGPRVTYNAPVNRSYRDVISRSVAPPPSPGPRNRTIREDFILSSRDDADTVLERMNDILEQYEIVSVADFNELVGYPSTPIDNRWGWTSLGDVQIRQLRDGYLIDLPPAEPIQ